MNYVSYVDVFNVFRKIKFYLYILYLFITLPDLSKSCVTHHSLDQVSDITSEAIRRLAIIQRARLKWEFYWPSQEIVRMMTAEQHTLASLIRVVWAHLHQSSAVRIFINSCFFTKVFSTNRRLDNKRKWLMVLWTFDSWLMIWLTQMILDFKWVGISVCVGNNEQNN